LPEKKLAAYRSDKTGFIFQDYFLEDKYTVYQNIEVATMINRIPERNRKDKIEDALVELGEDDFEETEIRLVRIKFLSEIGN
jgi:ABC-type lipoprotein export system ATPase subunit